MDRFKNKKVLIVGIDKTGFSLINFFNRYNCAIRITDIRPIFDLNKVVKKLKKLELAPQMTFGEYREEDFLDADIIVHSSSVSPKLPQLEVARNAKKEVYSEFSFANSLCDKPIIAVCGSWGRSTVAHMIGFTLKLDGKNIFVGGSPNNPLIEYCMLDDKDCIDYVIVEVSAVQMRSSDNFSPHMVVFTNISDRVPEGHFASTSEYIETKLSVVNRLDSRKVLIANFDKLVNNSIIRNASCQVYWYSRKSFVSMGVIDEIQGTHFHNKRIHSNIYSHSDFRVNKMRIIGQENRENLLAAITACKVLKLSDKAIQSCIEKFPGIPNGLEFLMEKNGVSFYNDSKSEDMNQVVKSVTAFKKPVILIMGGKDIEDVEYEDYFKGVVGNTRLIVLVGESKERMNRAIGSAGQAYIVGSFEESVLFAYQKSRTGDTIILSPGAPATDFFRDYEERGNYFKKLTYQL